MWFNSFTASSSSLIGFVDWSNSRRGLLLSFFLFLSFFGGTFRGSMTLGCSFGVSLSNNNNSSSNNNNNTGMATSSESGKTTIAITATTTSGMIPSSESVKGSELS